LFSLSCGFPLRGKIIDLFFNKLTASFGTLARLCPVVFLPFLCFLSS
jgi:hypothetical protein